MGIIYLKHINNKLNKNIKDNKFGNKLNNLIGLMIKNKCDITHKKDETILTCKKENKIHDLKIVKQKNKIKYIYSKENTTEIGIYNKIDNKTIIKFNTIKVNNSEINKQTEISLFEDNKEMIKKVEQENTKNKIENGQIHELSKNITDKTYIRTKNDNIMKVENNNNIVKYYIGKSNYKEGIYINDKIGYIKIKEHEFIDYIKNNMNDIELFQQHIKVRKK